MKKSIVIVINLIILINNVVGQTYFNNLINSKVPNTLYERIYPVENGNYIIPYDYGPSGFTYTSLIVLENFVNINELDKSDINSGLNPMLKKNKNYFHVGEKPSSSENVLICKKYNKTLDSTLWLKEYDTPGYSTINGGFTQIEDLYIMNVNRIDEEDPLERRIQILRIDTSGALVWSKNYGDHARYSYGWELLTTRDDHLMISQTVAYETVGEEGTRLFKIDQSGDIIWEQEIKDTLPGGATPIWITELSNGNTVQSFEINKRYDDNWDALTYDREPTRMRWFDSNGSILKEQLITFPRKHEMHFSQVETGKGDYFYAYGEYQVDDLDEYYGLIMKFDNNGDTIWMHRYQHPDFEGEDVLHRIKDIEELDNGDILVLGKISPVFEHESKIWLFKVDAQGCFGTAICDEVVSDTEQIEIEGASLNIYPNPVTDKLTITLPHPMSDINWGIIDLMGREINNGIQYGQCTVFEIDLNLNKGFYFIKVESNNELLGFERLIVD